MKPRKRASISGLVVVELVSGRRVIVSPDDLPRLGVLPPIASVRLAFESVLLPRGLSSVVDAKTNPLRSRSRGRLVVPAIQTPWRPLPATEIGVSTGRMGGQGGGSPPGGGNLYLPPLLPRGTIPRI
jgi:hypothetical protein